MQDLLFDANYLRSLHIVYKQTNKLVSSSKMFVLTTVVDTVRVPPSLFLQPTLDSVHQEIDKKYPNRVILDVGLVICRFGDATEISEGIVAPGDGAAFYEVVFQLIVFRPLIEEVCIGAIAESNEEGIRICLGEFFQDIFVPGESAESLTLVQ